MGNLRPRVAIVPAIGRVPAQAIDTRKYKRYVILLTCSITPRDLSGRFAIETRGGFIVCHAKKPFTMIETMFEVTL